MPSISFKPELLASVLIGKKTETRRISKVGDSLPIINRFGSVRSMFNICENGQIRLLYRIGNDYAIVPGRGQRAVGRVTVTNLGLENLFDISQESVDRECFGATPQEYIDRFQAMYKKPSDWNPWLRVITFKLLEDS